MTGNGSLTNPYIVSTWAEFLSVCYNSKYVKFADDVGVVDFSQEYPDGINKVINIEANVDGNGCEFRNILFTGKSFNRMFHVNNTIANLNFTNLKVSGNNLTLFHLKHLSDIYGRAFFPYGNFENCTFQCELDGNNSQIFGYGLDVAANIDVSYKNVLWGCNFQTKLLGDNTGISHNLNSFATNCTFDIDASGLNTTSQDILSGLMLQNCFIQGSLKGLMLRGDDRSDSGTEPIYQAGYTIINADSTSDILTDEYARKIIVNKSRASYGSYITGVDENQLKDKTFLTSEEIEFPIGNGNPKIIYVNDFTPGGFDLSTGGSAYPNNARESDWVPINSDENGELFITLKYRQNFSANIIPERWGFILKRADSSIAIPENNGFRSLNTTIRLSSEYADCIAIKLLIITQQTQFNNSIALYAGKIWQISNSYNNGLPYTIFMDVPYTPPPKPEPISELQRDYITIYSQETPQDGFETHGLGVLFPTKCQITEELNGKWELSIEHPIDDYGKWDYIRPFAVIKALGQLFTIRLVDIRWTGNKGTVSAKADHIFYQLNDAWIHPGKIFLSSHHAAGIINKIASITDRQIREGHIYYNFTWDIPPDLMVTENFFDNWSDLSSGATFAEFVMGSNGLIVGTSGEIYRDNFYFSIRERIENANDQAFDIRVGKNLRGIKRTIDTTRLCTYFLGTDDLGNEYAVAYENFPLLSPPHYVVRSQKYSYNIDNSLPLDERTAKSEELLENDVNLFFITNCVPKISYEVDLEDVTKNADYFDFVDEPDYRVGNIGYVHDDRLGGAIKLKITKTVKDAITGKTISVTFGDNLEDSSVAASRSAIDDIQITPVVIE